MRKTNIMFTAGDIKITGCAGSGRRPFIIKFTDPEFRRRYDAYQHVKSNQELLEFVWGSSRYAAELAQALQAVESWDQSNHPAQEARCYPFSV